MKYRFTPLHLLAIVLFGFLIANYLVNKGGDTQGFYLLTGFVLAVGVFITLVIDFCIQYFFQKNLVTILWLESVVLVAIIGLLLYIDSV